MRVRPPLPLTLTLTLALPLLLTLTLALTLTGEFDRLLSVRVLHREGDAALDQGADGAQIQIRHRYRCYALAMSRRQSIGPTWHKSTRTGNDDALLDRHPQLGPSPRRRVSYREPGCEP